MKSILMSVLVGLSASATASSESQSQVIRESKDERYQILGQISKVNQLSVSSLEGDEDGASISVFEVGGGDPALNGNNIFVSICPNSPEKSCAHFPYVLNMNSVKKVTLDSEKRSIIVRGSEDYLTARGEIKKRRVTYGIRFDWNTDGTVNEELQTYLVKSRK